MTLEELGGRGWGWTWRVEIDLLTLTGTAPETLNFGDFSGRIDGLEPELDAAVIEYTDVYRPRAGTLEPAFADSDIAVRINARPQGETSVLDRSIHKKMNTFPWDQSPMRVYAKLSNLPTSSEVKIFDGVVDRLEGIGQSQMTLRGRGSLATDAQACKIVPKLTDGTNSPRTTDEGTRVPIVIGSVSFDWVEYARDKGGLATPMTGAFEAFAQIPSRTSAPVVLRGDRRVQISSGVLDETPIDLTPALVSAWPDDNLRPLSFPDIGATQISQSGGYVVINSSTLPTVGGTQTGVTVRRLYSPQSIDAFSRPSWSLWENVLDGLDLDGYAESSSTVVLRSSGRVLNGPAGNRFIIANARPWYLAAIVQRTTTASTQVILQIQEDPSQGGQFSQFPVTLSGTNRLHLITAVLNTVWQNNLAGRPNWGELAGDWYGIQGSGSQTIRVHALGVTAPAQLQKEDAHIRGRARGRDLATSGTSSATIDVFQDVRPAELYWHGWGPRELRTVGKVIEDLLQQGSRDARGGPITAGEIEMGSGVYGSTTDLDVDLTARIQSVTGSAVSAWNCQVNDRSGRPLRELLTQLCREFYGHIWRDPADGKYKAVALGPLAGVPTPFVLTPDDVLRPPELSGGDGEDVRNAIYVSHRRSDGSEGRLVWIDGDDNGVRSWDGSDDAGLKARAQKSIDRYGRRVWELPTEFVSDPAAMFELAKRTFDQRVVSRIRMDVELRGHYIARQCGERFTTTDAWNSGFYVFPDPLSGRVAPTLGWEGLEWTILSADPTPRGSVRVAAEWSNQLVLP